MTNQKIFIGVSPDTKKPFYLVEANAGAHSYGDAKSVAAERGARLPTEGELAQIFEVRSHIDGLKTTGDVPSTAYQTANLNGMATSRLAIVFSEEAQTIAGKPVKPGHRDYVYNSLKCQTALVCDTL